MSYDTVVNEERLRPPLTHPEPTHMTISGTGLAHLVIADARDSMHRKQVKKGDKWVTDAKKIFQLGLDGGKPDDDAIGVQPEWFYKGRGNCVVPPGHDFVTPAFALDGNEEPEVVRAYIISPDGTPCRIGYALGNEFCDHVMERQNCLYRATPSFGNVRSGRNCSSARCQKTLSAKPGFGVKACPFGRGNSKAANPTCPIRCVTWSFTTSSRNSTGGRGTRTSIFSAPVR